MLKTTIKENVTTAGAGIIKSIARSMDRQAVERKLRQAAEFMRSSLLAGYTQAKDPHGKEWAPLADWYKNRPLENGIVAPPNRPVKSSDKPLTNYGTMKGKLTYTISGKTAYIGYGVKEEAMKAERHQNSKTGLMRYQLPKGKVIEIKVTPKERQNIGFAVNFVRFQQFDDIETIMKIFTVLLDEAVN